MTLRCGQDARQGEPNLHEGARVASLSGRAAPLAAQLVPVFARVAQGGAQQLCFRHVRQRIGSVGFRLTRRLAGELRRRAREALLQRVPRVRWEEAAPPGGPQLVQAECVVLQARSVRRGARHGVLPLGRPKWNVPQAEVEVPRHGLGRDVGVEARQALDILALSPRPQRCARIPPCARCEPALCTWVWLRVRGPRACDAVGMELVAQHEQRGRHIHEHAGAKERHIICYVEHVLLRVVQRVGAQRVEQGSNGPNGRPEVARCARAGAAPVVVPGLRGSGRQRVEQEGQRSPPHPAAPSQRGGATATALQRETWRGLVAIRRKDHVDPTSSAQSGTVQRAAEDHWIHG
mmetsp:Transcript_9753/g.33166  ORF Transcript_9753/g.33166 Transcript_9753/m.33166 type:complete len:348 (+) Transcript_9753:147-1190(+)